MIKQTSFSSPSVEHRCSVCMYEVLLLGFLLLLLASHFCPEQGQGIYPSSWPFLFHRLREARSATPIWPLKQNCPSLRASRIRGQRLFKVFSKTVRKEFAYGRIQGEMRISKHLNWSQQLHPWECWQKALAQSDVLQWWMKDLHPAWLWRHWTEWAARRFHKLNTREANTTWIKLCTIKESF